MTAIFPDQPAPVVRLDRNGNRVMDMLRCGFLAPPKLGNRPVTNVQRGEGMFNMEDYMEKPSATAMLVARDTKLPIARELSEMMLTQIDIDNSLASLTLWSNMYEPLDNPGPADTKVVRDSLFRDGITQFVGCFDSKSAFPLVVEDVFPKVEGIAPYFRWLRAIRNSYTAHRHGAARQCAVGALVDPWTGEFLAIGTLLALYRGPSQEGHSGLLALVRMAAAYVLARVDTLKGQFEKEAKALGPVILSALPYLNVQPQGPTTMGISRGSIRAGETPESGEKSA